MGDTGIPGAESSKPTVQVLRLWLDQQIAEKRYQLTRTKADVEKFITGEMKKMEADCIMLERDIAELVRKQGELDKYGNQDVIEHNP